MIQLCQKAVSIKNNTHSKMHTRDAISNTHVFQICSQNEDPCKNNTAATVNLIRQKMGQRKNGIQHNSLKKINAVVMGKDGVGKSGKAILLICRTEGNAEPVIRDSSGIFKSRYRLSLTSTVNTFENYLPLEIESLRNLELIFWTIT